MINKNIDFLHFFMKFDLIYLYILNLMNKNKKNEIRIKNFQINIVNLISSILKKRYLIILLNIY